MWSSVQVLPKKSFYILQVVTYESSMQGHIKNQVNSSVSTVLLRTLADFRCILHSVRLQE